MGLFNSPVAFNEVSKVFIYRLYGLASEVGGLGSQSGEGRARSEGPAE